MGKLKGSKEKNENSFDKSRQRDKNFFVTSLTEDLIKELDIVSFNSVVYAKDDENDIYVTGNDELLRLISKKLILTSTQYKELLYQINLKAPIIEEVTCFRCNNGSLYKNDKGFII